MPDVLDAIDAAPAPQAAAPQPDITDRIEQAQPQQQAPQPDYAGQQRQQFQYQNAANWLIDRAKRDELQRDTAGREDTVRSDPAYRQRLFAQQFPEVSPNDFQRLDREFYGQMRTHYNEAINDWHTNQFKMPKPEDFQDVKDPGVMPRVMKAYSDIAFGKDRPQLVSQYQHDWGQTREDVPTDDELKNWMHLKGLDASRQAANTMFGGYVGQAASGLTNAAIGVAGTGARLTGFSGAADRLGQLGEGMSSAADAAVKDQGLNPFLAGAARSVGQIGGTVAAGGATGAGALGTGALFAGQDYNRDVIAGRDAGLSPIGAHAAATAKAAITMATIGLGPEAGKLTDMLPILKSVVPKAIDSLSPSIAKSITEMGGMGLGNALVNSVSGIDPQALSGPKVAETIKDALVNGLVLAVGSHVAGKVGGYYDAAKKAVTDFAKNRGSDLSYNAGIKAHQTGDYAGAIKSYDKALQQNPDNWKAQYNRAHAKFEANDIEGAKADVGEVLKRQPKDADALDFKQILDSEGPRGAPPPLKGESNVGAVQDSGVRGGLPQVGPTEAAKPGPEAQGIQGVSGGAQAAPAEQKTPPGQQKAELTDLGNREQVSKWAAENPDKAAELADLHRIGLRHLPEAGIEATGNQAKREQFKQLLREEVAKQKEQPNAVETGKQPENDQQQHPGAAPERNAPEVGQADRGDRTGAGQEGQQAGKEEIIHHETSALKARDLLPGQMENESPFAAPKRFFSDNPDLALGQGENRGVKMEFAKRGVNLEEHAKPGTEIPGVGREFTSGDRAGQLQKAVRTATIDADAQKTPNGRGLENVLKRLKWDRTTNDDGSVTYRRPTGKPTESPPEPRKLPRGKDNDLVNAAAAEHGLDAVHLKELAQELAGIKNDEIRRHNDLVRDARQHTGVSQSNLGEQVPTGGGNVPASKAGDEAAERAAVGAGGYPETWDFAKSVDEGLKARGKLPTGNSVVDAMRSVDPKATEDAVQAMSPAALGKLDRNLFDMTLSDTRRKMVAAERHFDLLDRAMARMPEGFQRDSEMKYFRGESQGNEYLDKMANAMRRLELSAAGEVNRVSRDGGEPGTGRLERPDPNYIKGIYQEKGGGVGIVGRNPLEGPKGFTFAKTFANREEAEAAGYHPAGSWVERNLLAYKEQMRYVQIHDALNMAREYGGAVWKSSGSRGPEGFVKGDDKVFSKFAPNEREVRVAQDKLMEESIGKAEEANGVTRTTSMNMGRKMIAGTKGTEINDRFGSPAKIRVHELFHALDNKYDLWNSLGLRDSQADLQRLADARSEGQKPTEQFKKYANTRAEKVAAMGEAYLYAPQLMKEKAPNLYSKLDHFLDTQPALKAVKDIKPSLVTNEAVGTLLGPGRVHLGDWWVPEEFNTFLRDYTSKGLVQTAEEHGLTKTAAAIKAYQWGNNTALVGRLVGAFHAFTASMMSLGELPASGIMQAESILRAVAKGDSENLKSAGRAFASTLLHTAAGPAGVLHEIYKGGRLEREMVSTKAREQLTPEARNLVEGGVRVARGSERTVSGHLEKALRDYMAAEFLPRVKAHLGLGDLAIKSMTEKIMRPVMAIARFADHAASAAQQTELLRDLPPNASPADRLALLNQSSRLGEAAYGQVNYDRLKIHKSVMDGIRMLIQSPGWTAGNLVAFNRVIRDSLGSPIRAARGERIVTQPMAKAAGFLIAAAGTAALVQRIFAGKGIEAPIDILHPQIGGTNPDGSPRRANVFAYGRDAYNWVQHPLDTALSKIAPGLQTIAELWRNRDHFDNTIIGNEHPVQDIISHIAKTPEPFAAKNLERQMQTGGSAWNALPSMLGVTPSPAAIGRSPAMQAISDWHTAQGNKPLTPADQAKYADKAAQLKAMQEEPGGLHQHLMDKVDAGEMSKAEAHAMEKRATSQPIVNATRSMPFKDVLEQVWPKMTDAEETPEFKAAMGAKLYNGMKAASVNRAGDMLDQAKAAGIDPTEARRKYLGPALMGAVAPTPKEGAWEHAQRIIQRFKLDPTEAWQIVREEGGKMEKGKYGYHPRLGTKAMAEHLGRLKGLFPTQTGAATPQPAMSAPGQ